MLPLNEGMYTIYQNDNEGARVRMSTSSSSLEYEHALVKLNRP